MSAPLSLALCGIGRFAERRILPALAACPEIAVTAAISRTKDAVIVAGRPVPIFRSLDAFLDTRPTGALYVLTPNALHAAQTCAALDAGLDVLCEKPIATASVDAARMVATARAHGRHLQIAHVLRDSAALQTAAAWVRGGRIGIVTALSAEVDFDLPASARGWVDDPALAGGGVLIDLGAHVVDLCQWLLGGALVPESVTCDVAPGAMTETGVTAAFRTGAVACTLSLHNGRAFRSRLTLIGDRGRLVVDPFTASWGDAVVECLPDGHAALDAAAGPAGERLAVDVSQSYRRLLDGFAARTRRPPDYTAADEAVAGLRFIETLYDWGRRHP